MKIAKQIWCFRSKAGTAKLNAHVLTERLPFGSFLPNKRRCLRFRRATPLFLWQAVRLVSRHLFIVARAAARLLELDFLSFYVLYVSLYLCFCLYLCISVYPSIFPFLVLSLYVETRESRSGYLLDDSDRGKLCFNNFRRSFFCKKLCTL